MKSALFLLSLVAAPLAAQQAPQPNTIVTFQQGVDFIPRAINNNGQIAGYYSPAPGEPTRGFLRSPEGVFQSIQAPIATGGDTRFHGINDLGEIAGTAGPEATRRAFIRSADGQFLDLTSNPEASMIAYGINNSGFVVGSNKLLTARRYAFLRNLAGQLVTIAGLITEDAEAVAIANNTDRILVHRVISGTFAATHTNTATGSFSPISFQPNGQPAFGQLQGNGINASSAITGRLGNSGVLARSVNPTPNSSGIIVVTDGAVFQLPGATITTPYGINDRNQIVGTTTNTQGQQSGFLLNPCSPPLSVSTRAHGSGAEAGTFDVTPPDTQFCLWIADSTVPWISLSRSIGNGPGTVAYQLQANPTDTERQGRIRLGDTEFLITQAPSSCRYAITPDISIQLPPAGGTSTLSITPTAGNCPWTLSSPVTWARFLTPLSGTGNATVTVEVDPIPQSASDARTAPLNIAGVTVPLSQAVPACTLQLSRDTISAPAAGSLETVRVTASYPGCRWSLQRPDSIDWVFLIDSAAYGSITGSRTLSLRIDANSSTQARSKTLGLRLVSATFVAVPTPVATLTIQQPGASTCSYSLQVNTVTATSNGGLNTFFVQTDSSCPVPLSSNVPWIRVGSASSPMVLYEVDPNPSRFPRQGIITVAGLILTVNQEGNPLAELSFVPLPPCRILDTRPDQGFTGEYGPPALTANSTRTFQSLFRCFIFPNARAVAYRITAIPTAGTLTYLTAYSSFGRPLASTLNSWDGRTVSNIAILPVHNGNPTFLYTTDPTHVIAEVIGYFTEPTLTSLVFYPVTPCRLLDTRTSGNTPLPADTPRNLPVAGACGIPTNAAAFSLNVTAIPRNTTLESLTVYATGQLRPTAIPLNAAPGRIVANSNLLATSPGGSVTLHASHETDAVVDINGYFSLPSDSGLYFTAISPCRIADTRINTGTTEGILLPGTIRTFTPATAAACRIPANARAHLVNATVVPEGPTAFLSLFPSPTWTGSSTLNAYDGQVTANLAIVPDTGQGIGALASNPTHLVLDSSGYFTTLPVELRRPVPIPLLSPPKQQQ
jgi:hypothetical protein